MVNNFWKENNVYIDFLKNKYRLNFDKYQSPTNIYAEVFDNQYIKEKIYLFNTINITVTLSALSFLTASLANLLQHVSCK